MASTSSTSHGPTNDLPIAASPSSIPLYLINGVATVWDAQVAATLHCVHNISGLRAGTLPGVASQNAFLGLPLTLMQEETAYLVRQGIAHLVPVNPNAHLSAPTAAESETYHAARLAKIRAQEARLADAEAERNRLARARFAQAGGAAKEKREARARAKAEKERARRLADGEEVEVEETPTSSAPATSAPPAPVAAPTNSPAPATGPIKDIHFHTIRPDPIFPSLAHLAPITAVPHPLFPFPSSPRDRALLDTFTTLLTRGLRVGLGPRFGGEYLVYPGDYLRYHAHFTSQVLVADECIRPAEIVAWGRLGTGTKKAGLICCWEEPEEDLGEDGKEKVGEVEFYSLEWASFG